MARAASGRFEKGSDTAGPGRGKGVQNKTTRVLKDAMLLAAEACGDLSGIKRQDLSKKGIEQGTEGLVGYLKWAAKCEPKAFLHILGKLLPLQVKADSFSQSVYHSFDELRHDISQRGLNMKSFGQLLIEAHDAKPFDVNAGQNIIDVDNSSVSETS